MRHGSRCAAALLAVFFLGCSNYRFREALRPGGKYDLAKLKGELESRKEEELFEVRWFPLLHLQFTTFAKEATSGEGKDVEERFDIRDRHGYPPGHALEELNGYGPLVAFASHRESHFDAQGTGYEVMERLGVLWGLWERERSLVRTPYGMREQSRIALLFGLLGGPTQVRYFSEPATPAAGASPPG